MIHTVTACPVCQHTAFNPFLTCEDHTVTHETFDLQQCRQCRFVLTNPRPANGNLSRYYQSPDYISHSNRSQTLFDRVYQFARTITLRWKYTIVQKHSLDRPETLLDFGCGTGSFLQYCQTKGINITGVEPDSGARTIAQNNTQAKISASLDDVQGSFHAITLWHVLEHVDSLNETVIRLRQLLRETGTMFIAVPNLNSYDATQYQRYWAGYDVPRHLWHFSSKTMTRLLTNHDLKLVSILGMPLDAYYVSLLSEKYMRGKHTPTGIAHAIITGARSNQRARETKEYSSLIYIVRK